MSLWQKVEIWRFFLLIENCGEISKFFVLLCGFFSIEETNDENSSEEKQNSVRILKKRSLNSENDFSIDFIVRVDFFQKQNFVSTCRDTALNLAAHRQKYHIVDLLIQYRANPNIRNQAGKTALHRAVASYNDENANLIRSILNVGGDPTIEDEKHKTPLDQAVLSNKPGRSS